MAAGVVIPPNNIIVKVRQMNILGRRYHLLNLMSLAKLELSYGAAQEIIFREAGIVRLCECPHLHSDTISKSI